MIGEPFVGNFSSSLYFGSCISKKTQLEIAHIPKAAGVSELCESVTESVVQFPGGLRGPRRLRL